MLQRRSALFSSTASRFAPSPTSKSSWSKTLLPMEKSFDPAAGEADLFPQDITRALLNLISNGCYAASQCKAESDGGDYEPTLAASTKGVGDRVEIRIRDNGTG